MPRRQPLRSTSSCKSSACHFPPSSRRAMSNSALKSRRQPVRDAGEDNPAVSQSSTPVFFVIPAYNEGELIGQVIREVRFRYPNIIVVDDGSTDHTARVAAETGAITLQHLVN